MVDGKKDGLVPKKTQENQKSILPSEKKIARIRYRFVLRLVFTIGFCKLMMNRFFILFVAVFCFGCHSAPPRPAEPSRWATKTGFGDSVKQSFAKAGKFLAPDKTGRYSDKPSVFAVAASQSSFDLPQSANSQLTPLYQAGAISPAPQLLEQKTRQNAPQNTHQDLQFAQNKNDTKQTDRLAQTKETIKESAQESVESDVAKIDPLKIQKSDSSALKRFLAEIKATPKDERGVSDKQLVQLIDNFRNETDLSKDPNLETDYIALLRKKILPNDDFEDSIAAEIAESSKTKRKEREREEELASKLINEQTPPVPEPRYPKIVQASYNSAVANQFVSGSPPVGASVPNTTQSFGAGDWQTPLKHASEQLRYVIDHTPNGKTSTNEMRLRLMETLLGNKSEAAKPMLSAEKTLSEFMGHQVLGWAALLDDAPMSSSSALKARYTASAYRFNESLAELQKLCPIKMKNVVLIADWEEFGRYLPRKEDYKPGERFTYYVELENPTIRRTTDGYNVSVAMSYEIRDMAANVVDKRDAGKPTHTTLSRKHDYCLTFDGQIPKTLQPGTYQLRITVSDLNDETMQYTAEQIPLKVAPATDMPE